MTLEEAHDKILSLKDELFIQKRIVESREADIRTLKNLLDSTSK